MYIDYKVSYLCTAMVHNLFVATFEQKVAIRMSKRTHGRQRLVNQLSSPSFLPHEPIHLYNLSLLANFLSRNDSLSTRYPSKLSSDVQ